MSTTSPKFSSEFFDYLHTYVDLMEVAQLDENSEVTVELEELLEKLCRDMTGEENIIVAQVIDILYEAQDPSYVGRNFTYDNVDTQIRYQFSPEFESLLEKS